VAGLLLYGKSFRAEQYTGKDGRPHHEVRTVQGDFYSITNSTWDQLTELCSEQGIAPERWPVYETCIDVPLDEVRDKNAALRKQVLRLPSGFVQSHFWLEKIVDRINQGDIILYCAM
jgi:hypothetical protein